MATRASPEVYRGICEAVDGALYYDTARVVVVKKGEEKNRQGHSRARQRWLWRRFRRPFGPFDNAEQLRLRYRRRKHRQRLWGGIPGPCSTGCKEPVTVKAMTGSNEAQERTEGQRPVIGGIAGETGVF